MHEFNKAGADIYPSKRQRLDGCIMLDGEAKEIGESMYKTLVTRDNTPSGGAMTTLVREKPLASSGMSVRVQGEGALVVPRDELVYRRIHRLN